MSPPPPRTGTFEPISEDSPRGGGDTLAPARSAASWELPLGPPVEGAP
ncbi:MAG TPA: hypothetical protein VFZ09_07095 [Archangium sp.]|nr:hypothetical protein [Archangium sp.]HEX5745992.1 hypothetical protein [Archangium sp.]